MGAILAKKIYQDEHLIFNRPGTSTIISEQVNNDPTQAWLVKNPYCCGGDEQWQLEFKQPASMINVLTGVWIQVGAEGFLIDGNVADVAAKLNGCCGTNAVITQNYPNGLPADQAPVAKTYSVARTDDGTIAAAAQAELDYSGNKAGNVLPNSFSVAGRNTGTGVTTYQFQAYEDPNPQGTDVITETARVFTSNEYATALSGSDVYSLNGTADGESAAVKGSTTFASLVTALQADPVAGAWGTWTTAATHITLTTTKKDVAVLVVGQVAP